ncbi:MAG: hypothetical protein JWM52_845 [Candidatus Saccharibacteria bacterium]|nr:hypothetical protein [Candidatus Saccharibacteria bacterium]
MTDQRLPTINGDDGAWGSVLNQFLAKEHYDTGIDNPSNGGHAKITVRPGTTSAGSAPIKLSSGSVLTVPETGAIEFLTDKLYFTQTTGTTRKVIATYDDSSGATGDVYYRDSGGATVRLGIGGSNQTLVVSSGVPAWSTTGSVSRLVTSISVDTTAGATASTDYTYFVTGTTIVTLPTAVGNKNIYKIANVGLAIVTVSTTSSQTINGSFSVTLPINNMSLDIVSNNANWTIT